MVQEPSPVGTPVFVRRPHDGAAHLCTRHWTLLSPAGRRLLRSVCVESLEFRKVKIFSCWEAAHSLCGLYTCWEKLEEKKKRGKQLESRVCNSI